MVGFDDGNRCETFLLPVFFLQTNVSVRQYLGKKNTNVRDFLWPENVVRCWELTERRREGQPDRARQKLG
jgi:hypothetical protein